MESRVHLKFKFQATLTFVLKEATLVDFSGPKAIFELAELVQFFFFFLLKDI